MRRGRENEIAAAAAAAAQSAKFSCYRSLSTFLAEGRTRNEAASLQVKRGHNTDSTVLESTHSTNGTDNLNVIYFCSPFI